MGMRCAKAVAVGALLAGSILTGGAEDQETKGLKGRWVSEKFVWSGRESQGGEKMILVIGDDSVSWEYLKQMGNQGKSSGNTDTYKLDTSKKPVEIDLTITDGVFKGKTYPCIYQLDGDTLKLCRNQPGHKRPTEFASKKGSDTIFLVLKRARSGPEQKSVRAAGESAKALAREWRYPGADYVSAGPDDSDTLCLEWAIVDADINDVENFYVKRCGREKIDGPVFRTLKPKGKAASGYTMAALGHIKSQYDFAQNTARSTVHVTVEQREGKRILLRTVVGTR